MVKKDWILGPLALVVFWTILFTVSQGIREHVGSPAVGSLDLAISGGLSAALVILYFRQGELLDQQRELIVQQFNYEIRESHTETLRKRVRLWHGNPDREPSESLFNIEDLNIPRVTKVRIESADRGEVNFPEDSEFHVIPRNLRDDRYMKDFLENHASDLNEVVCNIQDIQQQYMEVRESFNANFHDVERSDSLDTSFHTISATNYFPGWVFEQLIKLHRGYRDSREDMLNKCESRYENASQHGTAESGEIRVPLTNRGTPMFIVTSDTGSPSSFLESYDSIKEEVWKIVQEELLQADDEYPKQAAKLLNEAEKEVRKLERLLIEYEGKPIYGGDCKYLDDVLVE